MSPTIGDTSAPSGATPPPEAIKIADRPVGDGHPCLIVGEVGLTHDGSLGTAHAFVDAIANAGADAVKFQTHIAAAESTPGEPWRIKFSPQDDRRYDYWLRTSFTEDQWRGLKEHAEERGLLFLSSPFSIDAIDVLSRIGVSAWKVASGEVSNVPMLERMADTGAPVLLSSGMSPFSEIDTAVRTIREAGAPVVVFQCTSAYPCPPEKAGLNVIPLLRDLYMCPVGLSDHSGSIYPGLAAAVLGVNVLEVHVTLSKEMFGPDVSTSLTTSELRQLVDGVRYIETMNANPVDKDAMAKDLAPLRGLFTKSVVAEDDLPVGTVLTAEHLALKKPGTGIPASRLPDLVGRTLARAVSADTLLSEEDLG